MELTERQVEILKAIVTEYIQSDQPVGSKTLQRKYLLPYSSATIRNDMQVLEEVGYLEKTHTSSGRIPSTAGYKYYVENLLDESHVDHKMDVAIRNAFDLSNMNMQEAIEESCNILSEMTNMVSGAVGPDADDQCLEHIKIFPIDKRNAVCVFITNIGHAETKNFRFKEDVSVSDIENCVDILNDKLKGVPISGLVDKMQEIKPELNEVVERHDLLFTAFVRAFINFASSNVYFSGRSNMLYQPEFEDITKLKKLISMLDDTDMMAKISDHANAKAMTKNGTLLTWYDDVAVVRSKFKMGDHEMGEFMILGPKRMPYGKVVSMVESAAKLVEEEYSKGGDDSGSGKGQKAIGVRRKEDSRDQDNG